MADRNLHDTLKGRKKIIPTPDFKDSLLGLCLKYLKEDTGLTDEQRTKVYRIYSSNKIMLEDF